MSELRAQYCNGDGVDDSGGPCPPAYRDLSAEARAFALPAFGSIDTGDSQYTQNIEPDASDVWDWQPTPAYGGNIRGLFMQTPDVSNEPLVGIDLGSDPGEWGDLSW